MSQAPEPRVIDKWQDAEHNAAEWMRYWGYEDAVASPGGSDGGIDIRASEAFAQVKFTAAQVGSPVLNRLVGAAVHSGRELFFFTGSGYAAPAIAYADKAGIALFNYDPWGRMTPVNREAKAVVSVAEALHRTGTPTGDPRRRAASPSASMIEEANVHPNAVRHPAAFTGRHWTRRYIAASLALWCLLSPFAAMVPGWLDSEMYAGPWYEDLFGFFIFELLGLVFLGMHVAMNADGVLAQWVRDWLRRP